MHASQHVQCSSCVSHFSKIRIQNRKSCKVRVNNIESSVCCLICFNSHDLFCFNLIPHVFSIKSNYVYEMISKNMITHRCSLKYFENISCTCTKKINKDREFFEYNLFEFCSSRNDFFSFPKIINHQSRDRILFQKSF